MDSQTFEELGLNKALINAIDDLGFEQPTPVQQQTFPIIMSGKNVVGISQTGTGKTLAYMLPVLQQLKFSKQTKPRIIVLVPTRELVVQVAEQIELFTKYMTTRIIPIYGGVNIKTQKAALAEGCDIVVSTPRRLYDLAVSRAVQFQDVSKVIIDEVDVMLDLGFRFQLTNLFDLLPDKRQNIMFSATMTDDVDTLIKDFFIDPHTISIAVSGTPLENIEQAAYAAHNFYTKVNLLKHILQDKEEFRKVLIFIDSKKNADKLFDELQENYWGQLGVIHSNKSQNNRLGTIEAFNDGMNRILIATDVIARGLDLDDISHVISFDVPNYPENYMHRIGRTGRAEKLGHSILLYGKKEEEDKLSIEMLMNMEIPELELPGEVKVSKKLTPEEEPVVHMKNPHKKVKREAGPSFHEKKDKNKKEHNYSGRDKIMMKKSKKYNKPIRKSSNKRRK